jgi:hypothetical protein
MGHNTHKYCTHNKSLITCESFSQWYNFLSHMSPLHKSVTRTPTEMTLFYRNQTKTVISAAAAEANHRFWYQLFVRNAHKGSNKNKLIYILRQHFYKMRSLKSFFLPLYSYSVYKFNMPYAPQFLWAKATDVNGNTTEGFQPYGLLLIVIIEEVDIKIHYKFIILLLY